jgi:hypothetical protein
MKGAGIKRGRTMGNRGQKRDEEGMGGTEGEGGRGMRKVEGQENEGEGRWKGRVYGKAEGGREGS